ncbi:sister chromatid cohesion acetyltransferas-like protein Eco1 [Amniculicola lignicola CBS 123094]|uniref:Sister chromatid cohesion acetyltransferas-like protein Eco1 n=1 Tax=Amniculicola lignicola CBS 123094 TaxID=1392246 RepID=A0A6A5X4R7_9PLEO|nr:sister chromatid cohesion acetyltransferas-like protein Eco1 [Amniculicola lignicola CBS 123094]
MEASGLRKSVKTYSRQKKHARDDYDPPAKRRRVERTPETTTVEHPLHTTSDLPAGSSSPAHDASILPTSSPKESTAIFSDALLKSTPPSSPQREEAGSPPQTSSPPRQARRPMFSFMKRRPEPRSVAKEPLSERSHNAQTPLPLPHAKKKRLVQMQLDLALEIRKQCKICGMEYIPSNADDAAVHKKFHAMNVGGVDFSKALIERIKKNQVWTGANGSFVAVIARKDALALRNKASEVLKVLNTELAAVPIPDEALWSQITSGEEAQGKGEKPTASGRRTATSTGDRFKVYLYIRGQKCVGACLAERISAAYAVLDQVDTPHPDSVARVEVESSSISISSEPEPALLGISRIWTSNLHRKHGVATQLLDAARSDFLYGMSIEKDMIAFSQPTESGGKLARKWFGQPAGWHVYID